MAAGDAPRLPIVGAGVRLLEGAEMRAYRAWVGHGTGGCPDCAAVSTQCAEAGRLWQAYREARA